MAEEAQFSNAQPTFYCAAKPCPLTIAEYRARQERKQPKKHKRTRKRVKLLQQRRLVKEVTQLARDETSRQRYKESLEDIENKLSQGAKQRHGLHK